MSRFFRWFVQEEKDSGEAGLLFCWWWRLVQWLQVEKSKCTSCFFIFLRINTSFMLCFQSMGVLNTNSECILASYVSTFPQLILCKRTLSVTVKKKCVSEAHELTHCKTSLYIRQLWNSMCAFGKHEYRTLCFELYFVWSILYLIDTLS